jgi:hypothetical protein
MIEVLRRNDIHAWHTRFIEQLHSCAEPAPLLLARRQANAR